MCDNGVNLAFTNYSWPIGVKRDRGLNITFTKDIILQPKGWLGAPQSGNGANVLISFKDDKNHFRCAWPNCQSEDWCNQFLAYLKRLYDLYSPNNWYMNISVFSRQQSCRDERDGLLQMQAGCVKPGPEG